MNYIFLEFMYDRYISVIMMTRCDGIIMVIAYFCSITSNVVIITMSSANNATVEFVDIVLYKLLRHSLSFHLHTR